METNKLKKDSLNIGETIALSVAIMGPSASVAVTAGMMVSYAGYSAPFIFLLAMIVIGFVAVSIIKLNQYFPSSGSVYYFAEKTLGKRAGFVTGWLILLAYLLLGTGCAAVSSAYFQNLLGAFGIQIHWKIIGLLIMAFVGYLSHKDAQTSTNFMLVFEVLSMGLILVLSAVILVGASKTTGLSWKPFQLGGNSFTAIGYAAVFGILAFSGFEGASSLGEESKNPKKTIPIAISSAVILSGVFYIFVSYAQVIGFGVSPEGIKAFTGSEAPLGELISRHLGNGFSLVILLCVAVSFLSSTLGCVSAGARVLYTMSRDKMLSAASLKIDKKRKTPYVGLNIYIILVIGILMLNLGVRCMEVGAYAVMTGTLALLLSYVITTAGAIRYFGKYKIWSSGQLIIPVLSILALSVIFLANIYPVPAFPMNLFSYFVIGWLILGIALSIGKVPREKAESIKKEA